MHWTSTYRLQMHAGYGFEQLRKEIPYLASLGISHVYLSPILSAVQGSTHGYDVLDHTRISADLGGREAFEALARCAYEHGLGVLVDIVPNHMAFAAPECLAPPLWALLKEGRDAPTAHWFDIDWKSGGGRIGMPILGDTLATTLQKGEIQLDALDDGEPVLRYFKHVLPISPGTLGTTGATLQSIDIETILARQHYQLASWRQKETMLNYRRFFDVDGLIAVRVEQEDVFDATHALLLELNHAGLIDGFRIDHPDGLADPQAYLARLRERARPGTLLWVEKILEGRERLPRDWPCEGTTGYDAMLAVQTALIDPASAPEISGQWQACGGLAEVEQSIERAKRHVVDQLLQPELERLTRRALEALEAIGDPAADEPAAVRAAVAEFLVAGEVYRAYVRPDERLSPQARRRLQVAFDGARAARPDLEPILARLLQFAFADHASGPTESSPESPSPAAHDFAIRLQQTWGPVMAKGIEDTSFYRWHRLIALNEVGGDPGALDTAAPQALHEFAAHQQQHWPLSMTTLSTHDTKRSEDTRATLLAIAGDPSSWKELSLRFRASAHEAGVDAPTAHFVWQTLAGVGSIAWERLEAYLLKAIREAKLHTAWVDGDAAYEQRVLDFARKALAPGDRLDALERVWRDHAEDIRATILGAKLLQLTMPGMPDVYQGCEIVQRTLVDPDNRREIDFDARDERLKRLDREPHPRDLDDEKLLLCMRALRLRRERPECFGVDGSYEPLRRGSEHALGFTRAGRVLSLVTRAPGRLRREGGWRDASIELPAGRWQNLLDGRAHHADGPLRIAELLQKSPVALMFRTDG